MCTTPYNGEPMKQSSYDYIIIGAGFAGLATAYFLLKNKAGSVCLIEKDAKPGLEASGRNASMICQVVRNPELCRIMIRSAHLIHEEWLSQFKSVEFMQTGSFHIGTKRDLSVFQESLELARKENVETEILNRQETLARCPVLADTEFETAFWCPSDGVIHIHQLIKELSEYCQRNGARFIPSLPARLERSDADHFMIQTKDQEELKAKVLINAAGAWAGEISRMVQAQPLKIFPTRRHIFVADSQDWLTQDLPIVWDVTHEVYFRPTRKHEFEEYPEASLLLSPCDEEPYPAGPTPVNLKVRSQLDEKLGTFLPRLPKDKYIKSWLGLRTFSEDRRFVIGWDHFVKNFFWVTCLGGYGLTASAGVGQHAASMILGQKSDPALNRAFSPERFLAR